MKAFTVDETINSDDRSEEAKEQTNSKELILFQGITFDLNVSRTEPM